MNTPKATKITTTMHYKPLANGLGQFFDGTLIKAWVGNVVVNIEYDYVVHNVESIVSDVFDHMSGNSTLPHGVSAIDINRV